MIINITTRFIMMVMLLLVFTSNSTASSKQGAGALGELAPVEDI